MNKTEFVITTTSSLLVALMMLGELIISNEAATAAGKVEECQRVITIGQGANRMYQIVAGDCSTIKNDPGMTELMLQHDITPQTDIFEQQPNGLLAVPSPAPSAAHPTHKRP